MAEPGPAGARKDPLLEAGRGARKLPPEEALGARGPAPVGPRSEPPSPAAGVRSEPLELAARKLPLGPDGVKSSRSIRLGFLRAARGGGADPPGGSVGVGRPPRDSPSGGAAEGRSEARGIGAGAGL